MTNELQLIGPFSQVLTFAHTALRGTLKDDAMGVIINGGILIRGNEIAHVDDYEALALRFPEARVHSIDSNMVAMPGLVDAHTHICFAGSRSKDFAARNSGISYQEIAKAGGGIWSTVTHTRAASENELVELMYQRVNRLKDSGITTVEVKSGYGLSVNEELKLLKAINTLREKSEITIIPTCLAAHIIPKEYNQDASVYINDIIDNLVPQIKNMDLCSRFDIFIEENAFSVSDAEVYLSQLKDHGFDITVHGDQFTTGGSAVAVQFEAMSVDHLEVSTDHEIELISRSNTVAMALPGASLGLGCAFTPCRKILDAGGILAIASDWNPGSAPMGDLLVQASILATFEKLSTAEVLAGITFRAAHALGLQDRGRLITGLNADICAFPCGEYSEIVYQQGTMKPEMVWKSGKRIK